MAFGEKTSQWSNFTLLPQSSIPTCAAPPVACTLGFVSTTVTNPTLRGDSNGNIKVVISGATGSTNNMTYQINGVVKTSSGSLTGYTFTNLSAGSYDIYIKQADGYCYITDNDVIVEDGEFRTGPFYVIDADTLAAVENPIIVNVGTALNGQDATFAGFQFTTPATTPLDYHITFTLTSPFEYTQTFWAKGFPNKPNYFLSTTLTDANGVPVGTNSRVEVAQSLVEALSNDAVISKVYNISLLSYYVRLSAKETGSKYNLNTTNNIFRYNASNTLVTTGFTFNTLTTGKDYCDGQLTDNYSIGCEVYANNDSSTQYPELGQTTDYNNVAELVLPFNQNNTHKFDISTILKTYVSTPKPDPTLTGSTMLPTVMQPYYTKLYEYYPLVANTNTIKKRYKTSTSVKWFINSALDRMSENTMDTYLGDNLTNLNPNFSLTLTYPTSGNFTVTVNNPLIDITDTGTTGVKYSIWNVSNTTQVFPWTTGVTQTASPQNSYYMRISGTTAGKKYMYSRYFTASQYYSTQDTTVRPNRKMNVKFLTNSPNPKQIQRASQEYLYFILPKNYGTSLKVKGDLYFYDGSLATGQTFFTITNSLTNAGGAMVMNLSYDKLGLANYEVSGSTNRKIKRAEIAVYQNDGVNGDQQYTDEKVYRFEIDEQSRKFGILFQNKLGMYDSYDMVGVVEEMIDRETSTYTVPLSFQTDGSLLEGFKSSSTYNTKVTKKITCNTGWIDHEHFDWLMELLESNNIYSYTTEKQNYLNLTDFSYKKSSLDDLFDAEFTFLWTIYENNITV